MRNKTKHILNYLRETEERLGVRSISICVGGLDPKTKKEIEKFYEVKKEILGYYNFKKKANIGKIA